MPPGHRAGRVIAIVYYQITATNVRIAASLHLFPVDAKPPQWVFDAYQWSEDLYLEANPGEARNHILLPPGESLAQRLPPDLWATLSMMWPANHPNGMLGRQKPWVVMFWLGMLGVVLRPGVETYIAAHARDDARVINYLETAIEFSRLMDMVSDADYQRGLALVLASDVASRTRIIEEIYAAWIGGHADAVAAIIQRTPLAQLQAVREIIFDQRNLLWLPRIISTLRSEKRTLILVGAGHLGGPSGLLALLGHTGVECQLLL
jgi:uncharacterized protein